MSPLLFNIYINEKVMEEAFSNAQKIIIGGNRRK